MILKNLHKKQPLKKISNHLVKKVTIYSWINQNKPALKVDDEEISKSDIIALKKRIMELEEENEILKKATAIFAKRK